MASDPAPRPASRPKRPFRPVVWGVALLSLATLGASGVALSQRIEAYNEAFPRPIFIFRDIHRRDFEFADRAVTITEDLDDAGEGAVTVTYDDDALTLPVQVPSRFDLPGLQRHQDWMRVFAIAERTGMHSSEFKRRFDAGEITPRLVVVVRETNAGVSADGMFDVEVDEDAWGWNETMRGRWTFAFHELLPEGGFRSERLRFPESARSFKRRTAEALRAGDPPPVRDPNELAERTWQYDAAVAIAPRPPSITHENQALRNAGWTLPVASGSVLVLMVSIAFALAPARVTATDPKPDPA